MGGLPDPLCWYCVFKMNESYLPHEMTFPFDSIIYMPSI